MLSSSDKCSDAHDERSAAVWVGEGQVADLDDALRAWVAWSNGFDGATCGVYSSGGHTDLLVARLQR